MASTDIWTIQRILQWTTRYFKNHGVEEARLDAELLLAHVLKKTRIYLYTNFDQMLNRDELAAYHTLVERRAKGICVAALTGHKDFMGLDFFVNEHVLIPRPDTEEWLEKIIQRYRAKGNLHVLDLGTGSGAILLSFLTYCAEADGVGVDISPEALAVAKKNAEYMKLENRVEFRQGDFIDAVNEGELFDGIFSNLPYIPSKDIENLSEDVKHEPHMALDGGEDGLVFYRRLAAKAGNHLKSGGFLAMEVGIYQAEIVHKMMEETGEFDSFEIISDLGGIERAVCCRKK